MAEGKKYYMCQKTLDGLRDKIAYLKGAKREEIIRKIDTARGFGDLSENSEYDEARNEQRANEADIVDLENVLENAVVYDVPTSTDSVQLGSYVSVLCMWNSKVIEYQIVGSIEADPLEHKTSHESPIGQALIEKKLGDTVEVEVPAGVRQYKITEIRLPE